MSPKGDLIGIAENDGTSCEKKILLSTLSMSGYLTNQTDLGWGGVGGQICPPSLVVWLSEGIFIIFSNWDLVLDVKDQNPKAQLSIFKIVA